MINESQLETIPPMEQVFVFVIDPSAGCSCDRINTINKAMREAIFQLREIQDNCRDSISLKIAVLEAGAFARWFSEKPVAVDDFEWRDLELGFGPMNWECTLLTLESQLSRKAMMHSGRGIRIPVIVFIASSSPDWVSGMDHLHANNWFKRAIKFAVSEDDLCIEGLKELITVPELCCKLDHIDQLGDVLREVLQRATTYIASGNDRPYAVRFWRAQSDDTVGVFVPIGMPDDSDLWEVW